MKYHIFAKILGPYLSTKSFSVNGCQITKSPFGDELDYPSLPLRERKEEEFLIKKDVLNYIQYPQDPVIIRNFQSEYLLTIKIEEESPRYAIWEAVKKIDETLNILNLVAQAKGANFSNLYDYDLIGIYIVNRGKVIRVKLPSPLLNTHNFFPKDFPRGFKSEVKEYLKCRDGVFLKALEYLKRARGFQHSGYHSELEMVMNLIKCIELISENVYKRRRIFDKKLKKQRWENTGEVINGAGKKLKVEPNYVKCAVDGWTVRNKADIAHKNKYFLVMAPVNIELLGQTAYGYLIKFFTYKKNSKQYGF